MAFAAGVLAETSLTGWTLIMGVWFLAFVLYAAITGVFRISTTRAAQEEEENGRD